MNTTKEKKIKGIAIRCKRCLREYIETSNPEAAWVKAKMDPMCFVKAMRGF